MAPALDRMTTSQVQTQEILSAEKTQRASKKQKTQMGERLIGQQLDLAAASSSHELFSGAQSAAGSIKQIELINFMNHAHLLVDLKPGVNFVFGRNGSGKSALLSGCMIGLGAKSNSLRADKLSELVRHGESSAIIRITLFNGGPDAYQPEIFGNEILIERTIGAKGTSCSSHKAKCANGSVVYQRVSEIAEICEHFNIQVTNPTVVLTQEKAKKFLSSTDDTHRYQYFMEATGLEQAKVRLLKLDADVARMGDDLENFENELPALEQAVTNAKQAYDDAVALTTIDGKLLEKKRRVQWREAYDATAEAAAVRTEVEARTGGIDAAREKVSAVSERLAAARAAHEQLKQAQQPGEENLARLREKTKQLVTQKHSLERERKQLANKAEQEQATGLKRQKEAQAYEDKAQELRRTRAARQEEAARERDARRATLHAQQATNSEGLKKADAELDALVREKGGSGERAKQAQDAERRARAEYDHVRELLKQAQHAQQGTSNKRLIPFSNDIKKLVAKLPSYSRKFRMMPVGPIGMHIKLKGEEKWGRALENAIGGTLNAFIVDSHADRIALESVCRELGIKWVPNIITSSMARAEEYELSEAVQPDPRLTRALDQVSFDSPIVQQVVIDKCSLEKVVLANTPDEGRAIAYARPPARNVSRVYLPDGYSLYDRNGIQVQDRPARWLERSRFLYKDDGAQLAGLQEQLPVLERELQAARKHAHEVTASSAGFSQRQAQLQKHMTTLRRRASELENELHALGLEGGVDEQEEDDATYNALQVRGAADKHLKTAEELRAKKADTERELAPLEAQLRDLKGEENALVAGEEEVIQNMERAYREVKACEKRLQNANDALAKAERAAAEDQHKLAELEAAAARLRERAASAMPAGEPEPDVSGDKNTIGARTRARARAHGSSPPRPAHTLAPAAAARRARRRAAKSDEEPREGEGKGR